MSGRLSRPKLRELATQAKIAEMMTALAAGEFKKLAEMHGAATGEEGIVRSELAAAIKLLEEAEQIGKRWHGLFRRGNE